MTRLLAALALCLLAVGCMPAFTAKILEGETPFYDSALAGRWYEEDGDRVTIRRKENGYEVTSREAKGQIEQRRMLSIRRGDQSYLIVANDNAKFSDNPAGPRLFTVLRYTVAGGVVRVRLPTEQALQTMVDTGALPAPIGRYCTPSVPAEAGTTEGVGPPETPNSATASPENPMTCAVFDVTLAQLASGGDAIFGDPHVLLTRRRPATSD